MIFAIDVLVVAIGTCMHFVHEIPGFSHFPGYLTYNPLDMIFFDI